MTLSSNRGLSLIHIYGNKGHADGTGQQAAALEAGRAGDDIPAGAQKCHRGRQGRHDGRRRRAAVGEGRDIFCSLPASCRTI